MGTGAQTGGPQPHPTSPGSDLEPQQTRRTSEAEPPWPEQQQGFNPHAVDGLWVLTMAPLGPHFKPGKLRFRKVKSLALKDPKLPSHFSSQVLSFRVVNGALMAPAWRLNARGEGSFSGPGSAGLVWGWGAHVNLRLVLTGARRAFSCCPAVASEKTLWPVVGNPAYATLLSQGQVLDLGPHLTRSGAVSAQLCP